MVTIGFRLITLLVLLACAGCGRTTNSENLRAHELRGVVDKTLPAESQQRQKVLALLFEQLQEGIADARVLGMFCPSVIFDEPIKNFYDGHRRLARWCFNGAPDGDRVPVILYFDDQQIGTPIVRASEDEEERTYIVTGTTAPYQISRL